MKQNPAMRNRKSNMYVLLASSVFLLSARSLLAGPVYQPPGANLTYGDVTHGQRVQSASSNPAAAASDIARSSGKVTRGTVLSIAAGLEYGNVQDLFDFIDQVALAYKPSDPGTGGGGPGQLPEGKPGFGIDLGDIFDALDPEFQATIEAAAREVARQTALLALISQEGYGKAFVAADAPFVLGGEHLGGAWTFGVNWSGTSKAFGLVEPIEFDADAALARLESLYDLLPGDPPTVYELAPEVLLRVDPGFSTVRLTFQNDSSFLTKASKLTELNLGYSRDAWQSGAGSLYLGAEAKFYMMQLSRLTVRFGDITDSDELFGAIRDNEFRSDNRIGIDLGALWVSDNYQLGAQVTNVNEPEFEFPAVDLNPYRNGDIIGFLLEDQRYTMERQLKLEASLFTDNRRWSGHLGVDANAVADPMGDEFQWLTLSAGFTTDSWWLPGVRFGYRQNLAGTKLGYLGVGLTAFKILNIDISSALDTVSIDGRTLPQGLMAAIGFQITW